MPKLYEYFGLIVLFYSNEHQPIHVHGKFQDRENKAEFNIVEGQIVEIKYLTVRGKKPLSKGEMQKFKVIVKHFKSEIVQKWIDFFLLNKKIKTEMITQKIN